MKIRAAKTSSPKARDVLEQRLTEITAANEGLKKEIVGCKQTEALLNGQKRVLEMIADGEPLVNSLSALVRLLEQQAPGMLGSILLIDRLQRQFYAGTAPNLPPEYVRAIYGLPVGPTAGSCGTAAFRRKPVVVKDIATDPLWKNYRDLALPHGLRACWSTPIFSAQRELLGTFAMYYREPRLPGVEHEQLVETATHIASIAITCSRAQAALRDSEAKLKDAQRIGNIGYWERDLVNDRITFSEETRRIIGLPPQEVALSQDSLQKLIYPDDRSIQKLALDDALKKGQPYDVEYRIIRPGGDIRFVHVRDEMVFDGAGRLIRMFGTVQDITEPRRAEELLKAREQEIIAIVEHSPDPIVRFDRNGRSTYVNPAFIRLNGGSTDLLLGQTARSAVADGVVNAAPHEVEIMERSLKTAIDTGKPLDFETTWSLPDGRRSFTIHLEPEFDANGSLTSVLSVGRDITEHKRAEESVRESHQLLQQVLAALPVGVAVTNQDGDILLINAQQMRIADDMIFPGRERWTESKGFWHDSGKKLAPGDWSSARALATGETNINELIDIESPNGKQKIIRNSAAPIRNAEDRIVGAVIVNEDVTEQIKSEDKLRQTEVELARIARLTIMGELTASIAHELNQPLAAVVTSASAALRWLAMSPPNMAEAGQAVQRIARDANRASEVIQRVRAMMKKREPARKPVDLNDLVRETVALIQPELKRKRVSLKTGLHPGLPLVLADFVQVQQVLLNLLINAIDSLSAVTDRPRTLHISTNRTEQDAVQVTVQDTGLGINPDDSDRVFEPFYTTKPNGLGMGLAISRSIVEAHGGGLSAVPHSGHGAVFQFTLPANDPGDS